MKPVKKSPPLLWVLTMATFLASAFTAAMASTANKVLDFQIPVDLPNDLAYFHDVEIGKGGVRILKMEICAPKIKPNKPLPALVYIHGGGWNKGSKDEHARKIMGYARDGYVGVSIQYRLTHEAIFPSQLEDCKLAIRFLRANAEQYHINPDKIGVWGSSAGSHLAALLGTTGDVKELEGNGGWPGVSSRVQAVVDWYGPANFITEFANNYSSVTKLLGVKALADPDKAKRAMPGTYASQDDPPFLVMHGNKDTTIPYADSVAFSDVLKKAGVDVTLIIVDGAGHGFKEFPEANETAKAFLAKHLKN